MESPRELAKLQSERAYVRLTSYNRPSFGGGGRTSTLALVVGSLKAVVFSPLIVQRAEMSETAQEERILYFGYGSNMLTERLCKRCPSAEKKQPSMGSQHLLKDWKFTFSFHLIYNLRKLRTA